MTSQIHRRSPRPRTLAILCLAAGSVYASRANAATPIIVQNMAGFEGLEEATVLYYPGSNTFVTDPSNYPNQIDESPMMIRTTLRNYYTTLGWWDGDRGTTNTDRQRTESKGIDNLGHQKQFQTFEYNFDFRMDPSFFGTSHFCHIMQLKETEFGSSGSPLVTVSLYKNGSVTEGRIQSTNDANNVTTIDRTFTFTPFTWNHVDVRITPTDNTTATGQVMASVNGDAFSGISNVILWSDQGDPMNPNTPSNDYRPKFGLYRGMGTSYGVPLGDSWIEHRTVTGWIGSSHSLKWTGGGAGNPSGWDTGATSNFVDLNVTSPPPTIFNAVDEVLFDDTSSNKSVTFNSANVAPGYTHVNASSNYTFSGSFGITGGDLRKDGNGTLTLATNNSYPGLTDVRAGTLLVTGTIGTSSLASIAGGTLKVGSSNALGGNATIGTEAIGGTLDINGFSISTEPVSVQGAGVSSAGAIINSGAQQTSALTNVTMTGDSTFGGTGRWDIRGTGATLGTGGAAYNLTKTGTNQISIVGATVDPALANITISAGTLAFQTSTSSMGDGTRTVTVAAGGTLSFYNTTAPMGKIAALNGGRIWAESGTGAQNTFNGPITLGSGGGIVDANSGAVLNLTGNISGANALTKNGSGVVTLAGANTYTGATSVTAGALNLAQSFTTGSSVTISAGADMQIQSSATTPNNVVLKTPTLTITGTGQLDLRDNKLIVTTTPIGSFSGSVYTGVTGMIQSGRNTGTWDGGGIITSMTDAIAPGELTTLGVATAHDAGRTGGTFGGVAVTADSTVLVMYTYGGDANLDGKINIDDYIRIDAGFAGGLTGWSNGDFNYDGKVNIDDYTTIIDANFPNQGAPFNTSSSASESVIAVPEPASVAIMLGSWILSARGRRRRRFF